MSAPVTRAEVADTRHHACTMHVVVCRTYVQHLLLVHVCLGVLGGWLRMVPLDLPGLSPTILGWNLTHYRSHSDSVGLPVEVVRWRSEFYSSSLHEWTVHSPSSAHCSSVAGK